MIKIFGKLGFHFIISSLYIDSLCNDILSKIKPISITKNYFDEVEINDQIDVKKLFNENDLISMSFLHEKYLVIVNFCKKNSFFEIYIGFYPDDIDKLDRFVKNIILNINTVYNYCICGFELEIDEKYNYKEDLVINQLISHENFLPIYLVKKESIKIYGEHINTIQQDIIEKYVKLYFENNKHSF